MSCPINKIKSLLTLRAVEVGPFEAFFTLKCAGIAQHSEVRSIDYFKVINTGTITSVIGHIGKIAIDTRINTGSIEEIGLIPANGVATCTDCGTNALHTVFVAGNTVRLSRCSINGSSSVPAYLIHTVIVVGSLGTGGVAESISIVKFVGTSAGAAVGG